MSKTSRFTRTNYCVSVFDENIFISVVLDITLDTPEGHKVEIVEFDLCPEYKFTHHMYHSLSGEAYDSITRQLKDQLLLDVTPSLYSLWHCGVIQEPTK